MSGFIVDDADESISNEEDDTNVDDDDDADLFDSVCAICDNGGDIMWYAHLLYNSCAYLHSQS